MTFELLTQEARLAWRVSLRGQPVIETSPLVMLVDGVDRDRGVRLGAIERYQVNDTYPWNGVHSPAVDRAAGARVTVMRADGAGTAAHTLDVRVFDNGVAFRHIIPGDAQVSRVPDETGSFTLPAGSTVWYHDFEGHYEGTHTKKAIADVQVGEWAAPPVTFKLPGGRGYASITEGGLTNYSGMGLIANGARGFDIRLGHAQPLNYPFKLRYGADEGARLAKAAAVRGTISTPWRVVIAGPDLDTLVNADIVQNVAAPPDPAMFPEGSRTAWVKPGRAVWRYLDGGENTFEDMQQFSTLAGELGFEYNLLEGFWQKWPEAQLRELVAFSKARGVGIIVWKHSRDLRTPEARKTFFDLLARVGVAGAKIDFFDHEAKEIVDLYATLLRDAAERRLVLNFHGANKPTGEARTWPNELTREAVSGFERGKTPAWATHDTTLPFTRYLAGAGDFTPTVFGERRRETSWAHQIAAAATFTSPLLVYGGHPRSFLDNPAVEIIKSIQAVWDETRVLPFSEIGDVAGFARRRGDRWIVAIMNGPAARRVTVDLGFLGAGTHDALTARDVADTAAAVDVQKARVEKGQLLKVDLRAGGGFVGRFTRSSAPAGSQ